MHSCNSRKMRGDINNDSACDKNSSKKEGTNIPFEFTRFDRPFGIEEHTFNIVFLGIITHLCMFYYFLYLWPFGVVSRWTLLIGTTYGYITGLGITVGAHRYWTHRCFKANLPLQYLLMLMQTAAMQFPLFKWCRDHRLHHKYMDSDADPHNSKRGFWFSHINWLFKPRHPEVLAKIKIIDVSDLVDDPVVRFQSRYYWELFIFTFFIIPMLIFRLLFPEMSWFHILVANISRHGVSLHFTFLVNSVAHMIGSKPYDKSISPTDNQLVSLLAVGEGWHNYHHTFPWDYKSAEFGYKLNFSTMFIHFFAMIGWAWDLKTVSNQLLIKRINRTGDGSHPFHVKNSEGASATDCDTIDETEGKPPAWGWGDTELRMEDVEISETIFRRG